MSSLDNVTSIVLSPAGVNHSKINTSLNVTIYGSCEQNGTPTPNNPVPIVCNNGIIKARHRLPLGYTLLEYLQSDGASYLIVPYRVNNKTVFYARYNEIQNGPQVASAVFGVTTLPDVSKANNGILRLSNGTSNFNRMGWGDSTTGSVINVNAPQNLNTWYEVLYDQNKLYQDNVLYATSATSNDTEWVAEYDLGIFARNDTSVTMPAVAKISSVWAKENGEYKINLIPARRNSDNVLGMYDLVSGQFFTNQGTGTFTAGNPVNDVEIHTEGTVETINDAFTNQYEVEDYLLGINSTYKDEQMLVLNVATPYLQVTRKVGVKVLDGTEDWGEISNGRGYWFPMGVLQETYTNVIGLCSHFDFYMWDDNTVPMPVNKFGFNKNSSTGLTNGNVTFRPDLTVYSTVDVWKQYLADQYTAGTPVTILYPLATPTMETKGDISAFKTTNWWLPITVEGSLSNLQISYNGMTVTSSGVFNNKDNITSVDLCNIPWENNSMENAFYYCDYLLNVSNINDSVTNMTETFSHCYALTTLPILPSAVTIMIGTFYQCYNLRITDDLIIPSNVTNMLLAFYNACRGLTQIRDITIPNSVINMKQAFQYFGGTTNASGVTARTIDIGTGVINMNSAFDGCILSATTFNIRSISVTDATNCFRNMTGYNRPSGTLYVHVPANSTTYNSFVTAGYSTTTLKDEVLLVADL